MHSTEVARFKFLAFFNSWLIFREEKEVNLHGIVNRIMYGRNLMTMLMHEMEDTNPVLEVLLNFSGIPSIREKRLSTTGFQNCAASAIVNCQQS